MMTQFKRLYRNRRCARLPLLLLLLLGGLLLLWPRTSLAGPPTFQAELLAPTLLAPVNGANPGCFKGNLLNYALTWSPVTLSAGLGQYELELYRAGAGTTRLAVKSGESYTLKDTCGQHSRYRWRVRVMDASGQVGPWSAERFFTLSYYWMNAEGDAGTTLQEPYDEALISCAPGETIEVPLRWGPVNDPFESYEIELTPQPGGDPFSLWAEGVRPETIFSGECGGEYRWRVRAFDDLGNAGLWTESHLFSLVPDASGPPPPTLFSFDTDSLYCSPEGQLELTLQWQPVAAPESGDRYEVELAKTPGYFSSAEAVTHLWTVEAGQTELIVNDNCAEYEDYSWRVRVIDPEGNPGRWSDEAQFSVKTPEFDPVSILDPKNGVAFSCPAGLPREVILHWQPLDNPFLVQYQVELTNLLDGSVTTGETFGDQTELSLSAECGADYQWRVWAIDTLGNTSEPSEVENFSLWPEALEPPSPTPLAPVDWASLSCSGDQSLDFTLSWEPVLEPSPEGGQYEVELAQYVNFLFMPDNFFYSSPANHAEMTLNRRCGSEYYWRVRAVDSAGVAGPWSTYAVFQLLPVSPADDATTPTTPVAQEPGSDEATTAPVLETCEAVPFRWEAAFDDQGLSGYKVYLQQYDPGLQKWEPFDQMSTTEPALSWSDNLFGETGAAGYRWRVQAVDYAGNASPSAWLYFNCPQTSPPIDLSELAQERLEVLELVAPAFNPREPVTAPSLRELAPSLELTPTWGEEPLVSGVNPMVLLLPGQDLVVQEFQGPQSARLGQQVGPQLTLVIANNGHFEAGEFFIDLVLSPDEIIDSSDRPLSGGREYVSRLGPGETLTVSLDAAEIPLDGSAGNFYIGVILDSLGYQAEMDEANNSSFFPIDITPY